VKLCALAIVAAAAGAARADDTADLPAWAPGPAKFAVTPFENHVTNGRALDWIIAEAPFEIAEKSEAVLGLDPVGGPAFVGGDAVPAEADTVAAFANKLGAAYVVTGWFDKPQDALRIDVVVWKLDHGVARIAGEAQQQGPMSSYHSILGDAIAAAWSKAGVVIDVDRKQRLGRALSKDVYPVFMMGRGLGFFTGAFGNPPDMKNAEHDLERAVFLDPKLFEAQRMLGELYLAEAANDPKAAARAAAKFNYATDLAPDDIASLRSAAVAASSAGKWEVAREELERLVRRRPWDLDARYRLGAAMWQLGDGKAAERQLEQVTRQLPDQLAARRVLVLIHAARSDTPRLVRELEAIAARAPDDLEVQSDLATAYGALGQWAKTVTALERIAAARPGDLVALVRVGDAHRNAGDLKGAIAWYGRAAKQAPESSLPGFLAAQTLHDAGQLGDAVKAYTSLQRFMADLPAAEQALGAIAIEQNRATDAAWYLRRAAREAPRSLPTRQALIAAELMRKDAPAALAQLEPALTGWPDDATLHYLAGIARSLAGDANVARDELTRALELQPAMPGPRAALGALDAGGTPVLEFRPTLVRPWGDGAALQAALDRYTRVQADMAAVRQVFQDKLVVLLGAVGVGPQARARPKSCPVGELAPAWSAAQQALAKYQQLGIALEAEYRYLARHDEAGLGVGLLPNARAQLVAAKRGYKLALADVAELRAEWTRGLAPELRVAGCSDQLLRAAIAHPSDFHVIEEDKPEQVPAKAPPRSRPRSTFFVDNTRCPDPIDVWIDGALVGQVAPGRRSALVADGGERTLCLLGPGAAQCGDRGTVRQVYLHDGWSVTMHCPK
jgi:tetratricopeptide (TPR) repeat protein